MNRLVRLILISSSLCSVGAHLVILQSVAWAKMAVHYSHGATIQASLQKTFDGRHPCALCLKVRKATPSGPTLDVFSHDSPFEAVLARVPSLGRVENRRWTLGAPFITATDTFLFLDSPPPNLLA